MKLSIIIPYYNAKPYTDELLEILSPQITNEVEVILIDDGSAEPYKTSYEWVKVIRQKNGGASKARNTGLDKSTGEYIAFIDADDLVAEDYVKRIIEKIDSEHFDYCYLSWRTLPGGWHCAVKLHKLEDKFPSFNLCVWNRIYKRTLIGDTRFNEKKRIAEDAEFIRDIEDGVKSFIGDYMYFYRSDTPNSLTKRFRDGQLDTKRVVYYLPYISKNMNLIDEVRETDREAEVIILTNRNEQPELSRYAMIMPPTQIYGTELRGQQTSLFTKITLPVRADIVIFTHETFEIGGIETFIYNFCSHMRKYYDILVLYDRIAPVQRERLDKIVRTAQNNPNVKIECTNVIINRITDKVPINVRYKKKIQMCHMAKLDPRYKLPADNDIQIPVSKVVADSFECDLRKYTIINNLTVRQKVKEPLLLVSATRLATKEKGFNRIKVLCEELRKAEIPFIWLLFSDATVNDPNVVNIKPTLNILPYIKKADYLVQLSDSEAFCYSIVEALEVGTPVITTPLPILEELGYEEGVHGYIIPFEIVGADLKRLYNVPTFTYKYDNAKRVRQWRKVLEDKEKAVFKDLPRLRVKVTQAYSDIVLCRVLTPGDVVEMPKDRAREIQDKGFGVII